MALAAADGVDARDGSTAICTLRQADPNFAVVAIIAHVAKHHGYEVGETKVKEVLRAAGLARRGGPPSGAKAVGEVRLELAGMRLVEAASVQTGYVEALTTAMMAQPVATPVPASAAPVDTSGRDELGRFEADYNERFRKKPGDVIGPGFASVETTRASKDPARFHLNQVKPEVLSRKLWALMVSPVLGTGRWDGIRVARGALLGELCGYPYMPSTLDLFTRDLRSMSQTS